MSRGNLYTIFAPSGAGKTSLVAALVNSNDTVKVSISTTTRPMRPGEQEGVNYFFVSEDEFRKKIKHDEFLEYAEVFGCLYGTSRQYVDRMRDQGFDVILEIDWQGVRQVRELLPETIGIFIAPPSWQVLETRLHGRAQDKASTIVERMRAAASEMSHYHEADYLVINDDFNTALADLQAILRAGRLTQHFQSQQGWAFAEPDALEP